MDEMPAPRTPGSGLEAGPPFWTLEALLLAGLDRDGALAELARLRPEPGCAPPIAARPQIAAIPVSPGY